MIDIADGIPSQYCIDVNAHALARYAALCQDAGIVPIVEPEVLMDGDHSIERCFEVTTATLHARVRRSCFAQRVELEGMLLKPNMVLPGYEALGGKASRRARSPSATVAVLPRDGARRGARHRVPVGRAERRGGDRATSTRSTSSGPHPWQVSLLVRPRAPGGGAEGVAGRGRQRRRRPEARTSTAPR